MLVTLFGISVLVFVMLRLVPGNIADIVFNAAGMIDVAEKARLEKELGLDQPIYVQYAQWINGLAHGDLGYSYVSEKPALHEIAPRIPITAKLAALALLWWLFFSPAHRTVVDADAAGRRLGVPQAAVRAAAASAAPVAPGAPDARRD